MEINFQYPLALWLLLLVPLFIVLYAGYRYWRRRVIRRSGDMELFKKMIASHSATRSHLKMGLLMLAFGLGCIAVANPRIPAADEGESRQGIDLVIALDVSNSMLATDIAPSRLERAKFLLSELIRKMPDDRIGLVEFAGNAYLQLPLTFDHDVADMYLSAAHPGAITAQGTSIGEAFRKSDLAFGEEEGRFKTILLVTDGETHDEDALQLARELAARGIMINTVGIGSPQGTTITDPVSRIIKTDPQTGQPVISRLNEPLLQQLAGMTNGLYLHLQDTGEALSRLSEHFSQMEKTALPDASLFNYRTYYMWLALPMLLLLLAELFYPERRKSL